MWRHLADFKRGRSEPKRPLATNFRIRSHARGGAYVTTRCITAVVWALWLREAYVLKPVAVL